MTRWSIGKQLTGGFGVLVLLLCCVAGIGAFYMRRASQAMSEIAVQHLPEMQLATAFEREILNARIHFIYHVTIQKPGALEAGWDRFRKARALTKIPPQYLELRDYLMVSPGDVETAFIAANPGMTPASIAVTCDSRRLSEVRVCLSKDFRFRDCPEIDRRACRRDKVVMPPVRGG